VLNACFQLKGDVVRFSLFVKSAKPCNVAAAGGFAFTNDEKRTTNNVSFASRAVLEIFKYF